MVGEGLLLDLTWVHGGVFGQPRCLERPSAATEESEGVVLYPGCSGHQALHPSLDPWLAPPLQIPFCAEILQERTREGERLGFPPKERCLPDPTSYSPVLHGANGYRSAVCLGAQMELMFGDPALPSV